METLEEKVGDIRILHLQGRLDLAASEGFRSVLSRVIGEGATKIVMECRDLQYVSSSGIGAFIAGGKQLGAGGKLVFAGLNRHVHNVFEMTGLSEMFQVFGSKDEALRQLRTD